VGKDTPDWGGVYPSTQFYPLTDMAELAARLGSPLIYDRRGNVVWMYGFEYGLTGLAVFEEEVGSSVALSIDEWEHPPCSALLRVAGLDLSRAYIRRHFASPTGGVIGWAAACKLGEDAQLVEVAFAHFDGTYSTLYHTRIDHVNHRLEYLDDGAIYRKFAGDLPDYAEANYFLHMKLVVNVDTGKYVRFLLDNTEYDLSALSGYRFGSGVALHARGLVMHSVGQSATSDVYVDSLILTENEPV